MNREERTAEALKNLEDLIKKANLNMTVDELINVYSRHKGVKCHATNVWSNIYQHQLQLPGNYKYLYRLLEDDLAFLKPTPKVKAYDKRAHDKYNREKMVSIAFRLSKERDADLLEIYQNIPNKMEWFREALKSTKL